MAFTDKLKLIIDVDNNGAIKGLAGIKSAMADAEGFTGKLKAGVGGLRDSFNDLGPGAKAGIAAGGITAVGAAAVGLVSDFADLGTTVGQFSDATGLSTQESSRWVEVADEMGISSGTLESVLGKMNKSIDPSKWAALGIEIAKAKDGTTDVSATFLNAIEHLHGIDDAAQQAKEGAALFGKGWQQVSELVGEGADKMRQKLAEVEDQKILSPEDVQKARDYRHTMDELHDALQDVALTLGKDLLPLVNAAADQFTTMIHAATGAAGAVTHFGDSVTGWLNNGHEFQKSVDEIIAKTKALQVAVGESTAAGSELGFEKVATAIDGQAASTSAAIDIANQYNQQAAAGKKALADQAAATDRAAASAKTYTDTLRAEVDALHAQADAINEQISAAENAADSQLALNDAEDAFIAAAQNTVEVGKQKGQSSADYRLAVNDERDALIATSKAQQQLSADQAEALGVTVTATQHIDDFNKSLEDQATFATPAARKAAYDYLIQLNQIPPEKASEIQALIDQGRLDEANALMAEASRTREAAILADAKTAQAEADLERLARDRSATITVRTVAIGGTLGVPVHGATGGIVTQPTVALIGEAGPEAVVPLNKTPGSSPLAFAHAGGGDTFNIFVRKEPSDRWMAQQRARARRLGQVA